MEVALDRLPAAAGRDAHLLVVIARRAAGRECIVEPEAVFGGQAVGDIRETGRALVGRNDQVGIVAVAPHDTRRGHDLAVDDVVRDVEQAADECLVAMHAVFEDGLAVALGNAFREEAAFRARRHDDRVLHDLGLHESQHLGTEVFPAVRPAQAAACDVAVAQVHTFNLGRVDEDLVLRPRPRNFGQPLRVQLDRDIGFRFAVDDLEVVTAQRRADTASEG